MGSSGYWNHLKINKIEGEKYMNNLVIKNEMEKKEYFESLLAIISDVSKQNIDLNLIKGIR